MGIYDRDYERNRGYDDSPGFQLGGAGRTWTTNLVIAMGIVYVVQLLTRPGGAPGHVGWFTDAFSLYADLPLHPWKLYQLITYGFLHDPDDFRHIAFNCFGLWMFGRIVEERVGRKEYLAFFLVAVAFAGAVWVASEFASLQQLRPIPLLGASGGIAAVLVLFCLCFPRQTIFLGFLFPIPAWVFAILFVGQDVLFALRNNPEDNVAYTAHIGGALFAIVYFKAGWRLSSWLPGGWKLPKLGRGPSLRVHDPADDGDGDGDDNEALVDDILRKIKLHGQDSLTRRERTILEQASREFQRRRQ